MEVRVTHSDGQGEQSAERLADGAWQVKEGDAVRLHVRATVPVTATLGGERLPLEEVSPCDGGLESRFQFRIDTWAGRTVVQLRSEASKLPVVLDVQPHPGKLGLDAFREMLDELTLRSKDLPWGLSPGTHESSRDDASPAIVHPAILEAELPALLAALRRLRAEPLTWSERLRVLDRLPANRRVDPASFRWLVTHPRALESVRPSTGTERRGDSGLFIEQHQSRSTLEHPATRYLRYLLERLLRALSDTARRFENVASGRAEGNGDALVQVRARECVETFRWARAELAQYLRARPFRDVRAAPPDAAALQAIVDHPVYAQVQRLARRLIDPGLRLEDGGGIEANLRRTYDLFELLVLYRLGSGLTAALGPNWRCTDERPRAHGLLAGPADGRVWRAVSQDGTEVELLFQQTFKAWSDKAWSDKQDKFQSLSGERRPDYVLLVRKEGHPVQWLVLDAKYRSRRSAIHEGLADLHVYRDALRWNESPPSAGFILVPRLEEGADCYADPDYHDAHRFGAIPIHGGQWLRPILAVLGGTIGIGMSDFIRQAASG